MMLPPELTSNIILFSCCNLCEFSKISLVSTQWYTLIKDNFLLYNILKTHMPYGVYSCAKYYHQEDNFSIYKFVRQIFRILSLRLQKNLKTSDILDFMNPVQILSDTIREYNDLYLIKYLLIFENDLTQIIPNDSKEGLRNRMINAFFKHSIKYKDGKFTNNILFLLKDKMLLGEHIMYLLQNCNDNNILKEIFDDDIVNILITRCSFSEIKRFLGIFIVSNILDADDFYSIIKSLQPYNKDQLFRRELKLSLRHNNKEMQFSLARYYNTFLVQPQIVNDILKKMEKTFDVTYLKGKLF